jgi:hypothetical protein
MHGPAGGCRPSRRPLRGLLRHCEPTGRANARPMTGSAKQSIAPRKRRDGLLPPSLAELRRTRRRFAPRNDGLDIALPSRGMICPKLCMNIVPPNIEGAGNAGYALHPRSRVPICAKRAHTSIQVQRRHSGIPCAMVLRLMPCSPRRRIRLVTVAAGLRADTIRLDRCRHRQFDISNGCQDHTVLPYANSVVRLARRCSLTAEPPCEHISRRRCRVHRIPCPTSVTIAIRPSWRAGTAGFLQPSRV